MTDEKSEINERDERVLFIAEQCIREINLYFMAHGRSEDTLHDVLKALSLVHRNLWP
jgi:hypothetical protein